MLSYCCMVAMIHSKKHKSVIATSDLSIVGMETEITLSKFRL